MARTVELSEVEIQRLFIRDHEWERTHPTWKALKPKKNFNEFRAGDETTAEYANRIGTSFGFPEEVLSQWIYPHYFNWHTVQNYGWIDFERVLFVREVWGTD